MFWLYILIGVLVVVVGGGFIVCNLSEIEVDEDETMSHISFGNFILRKFDNFDNDF
jgi:hypothetical protein